MAFPTPTPERTAPHPSGKPRRVVVLGSTGSVGINTLDVAAHLPDRLQILGLSAHSNWEKLFQQAQATRPRWVALTDPEAATRADRSLLPSGTEFLTGPDAVLQMVSDSDTDIVVSAIVGAAGLHGTWAALEAGKPVALANKETLVMAGQRVRELVARHGGKLIPVDSEHSAIFQAVGGRGMEGVGQVEVHISEGYVG